MRVGPRSRGKARVEVEFKGERAGREGSEGDGAFYRRQKRRSAKRERCPKTGVGAPLNSKRQRTWTQITF